ncbi:MAG: lipopolysaccharide heptosyltransferase I [Desulfuromonadales bacterium]
MKVLIVKVSALGDIVHALPVLAHLHAVQPDIVVDWLVESTFASLLEGHPLLRKAICLDTRGWRRQGSVAAVRGACAVGRQLRDEKYDVVLDLQGNSKSGLFTWLSGARKRFGFDASQAREWLNTLATNYKVSIPRECHHISSRYLRIARVAFPGATDVPLCGPLPVQQEAAQAISAMLEKHSLVRGKFLVAHYGTTWETKLWPLDRWIEFTRDQVVDKGRQLVLTWGNDVEKLAAERIYEACQSRAVIWPRGTMHELVALLAEARLVIGADTGPIHIAAAVGTPTVSLFRVTDSQRNGPPGDKHLRLQAPMDCSPCLRKSCDLDRECGHSITVASVQDAVEKLLAETKPESRS